MNKRSYSCISLTYFILFFHYNKVTIIKCQNKEYEGLAYGPYREFGSCPDSNQIENDIRILKSLTNKIRIYALECEIVTKKLIESGLELLLGIWIDNKAIDKKEINRLYKLLEQYPNENYAGIAIGNEAILRGSMTPNQLSDLIQNIKYKIREIGQLKNSDVLKNVPIFSVEASDYDEIIECSDVIGLNIHPFYDQNLGITNDVEIMSNIALEFTKRMYNRVKMKYNNKEIYITETGWPSKSASNERNRGSLQIQKLYFKKFNDWAEKENIKYYWFEIFDATWKRHLYPKEHEDMSEFHWGLYHANHQDKKH